jgi:hypothetical protein
VGRLIALTRLTPDAAAFPASTGPNGTVHSVGQSRTEVQQPRHSMHGKAPARGSEGVLPQGGRVVRGLAGAGGRSTEIGTIARETSEQHLANMRDREDRREPDLHRDRITRRHPGSPGSCLRAFGQVAAPSSKGRQAAACRLARQWNAVTARGTKESVLVQ